MEQDLIIKRLQESCTPGVWAAINQHFKLEITGGDTGELSFCLKGADVLLLRLPALGYSATDLAYLLLRIYLRAKGFFIQEWLQARFETEPLLSWALDANLFLQLGDILEGGLVRTMRLDHKGEQGEGQDDVCKWLSGFSLPLVRRGFGRPAPPPAAIHAFILSYFRWQAASCRPHKAKETLNLLDEVCPTLYAILEGFYGRWLQLDLDSDLAPLLSRCLLDDLVRGVGRWVTEHVHAKNRRSDGK